MADLEARKAEIRERLEEGVEVVNDLEDERDLLDAARAEAYELDQAKLSRLHREYMAEVEAGNNPSRPIGFFQNRAAIEERAEKMPVEIDKARLEVAQARLELARLERSESLAAETAPRERLERIKEEVSQLQAEERQADQEATHTRRATEAKQREEFAAEQEVRQLEEAVKARVRVNPLRGVEMG